jgi:ribosomal protein S27AE
MCVIVIYVYISLNTLVNDNRVVYYRKEVIMFDDDDGRSPEKFSRQACKRCGKVTEMANHWWEFISSNCDPCEDIVFAEWQKKSEAWYVNRPEGESY